MKKLLFASACVATVAAFGASLNSTSFEGENLLGKGVANRTDAGAESGAIYFCYESASESTDGSTVKSFGVNDNLPITTYGKLFPNEFVDIGFGSQYLELSTEGGTLWRGANTIDASEGQPTMGSGIGLDQEMDNCSIVYVDTMVQFTPTEDGNDPQMSAADKLALWLNVTTDEASGTATTNLCVRALKFTDSYGTTLEQTFTIQNVKAEPSVWYRLTVKACGDVTGGDKYPGFLIYVDGKLLESDVQAIPEEYIEVLNLTDEEKSNARKCAVFVSREGQNFTPTFQGIGFKGSGAIDDLVITEETPNFFTSAGSLDFTLVWGEDISAVTYTINGGTAQTATSGTAIECEADAVVTISATPANVWLAVDPASVAGFTVTEAGKTYEIKTKEITSPIAGELTADVKDWATAKGGLTPDQITACPFAKDAYLMNTDLSAAPGLLITSITEVEGGWQITVKGTQGDNAVTLNGIRGVLQVKAAAALEGLADADPASYDFTVGENGEATIKVTGEAKNFMKATVVAK